MSSEGKCEICPGVLCLLVFNLKRKYLDTVQLMPAKQQNFVRLNCSGFPNYLHLAFVQLVLTFLFVALISFAGHWCTFVQAYDLPRKHQDPSGEQQG